MTKRDPQKRSTEKTVRDIRRGTCRKYSVEEKNRSVREVLRGEDSIDKLGRLDAREIAEAAVQPQPVHTRSCFNSPLNPCFFLRPIACR